MAPKNKTHLWIIALAFALLASQFGQAVSAAPEMLNDCTGATVSSYNAEFEQRVIELVNLERARSGIPPLQRVESLEAVARAHANDMATENYFSHTSQNPDCSWDQRILAYYDNPQAMAENIAAGQQTPEDVVASWMSSPNHHDNLMDPAVREVGIGFAPGGPGSTFPTYWVQNLGARFDTYPMVINAEARYTTQREVDLYIHGSWKEIRLRTNDGAWSTWMPFANHYPWTLPDAMGEHTISAQMRSATANGEASDTIYLTVGLNLPAAQVPPEAGPNTLFLPSLLR